MATQTENAVINLVINGNEAIKTYQDLNKLRGEQIGLLKNLDKAAPNYAEQKRKLDDLNAAHSAWKKEIYGGTQALQQQTEAGKGFFTSFKDGFAQMAGNVTAATLVYKGISSIIGGIKGIWNGSEQAYDEAQRTQTQLQTALRSTGGVAGETQKTLEKYQETLMKQTGVDDDVIAKGEDMLLTFTNVRGKIYEDALPAIVDMTSALNGGRVTMEGIQATSIQVGKALNDPIAGMTALKKVGVSLDEQQKEQIRTLVKSNDMMGAQAIIIKELNKEFGGRAKAIADTEDIGKIQKFETAYGNLQEVIGKSISTAKAGLASFFQPLVEFLSSAKTKSEDLTDAYRTQSDNVNDLQKNTAPLIDRYEKLTQKGNLNKKEQIELNTIIGQLSSTIPGAVTQWDKYGNALGINTDKARDFIKMQQEVLKFNNKEAIEATQQEIKQLQMRRDATLKDLNEGFTNSNVYVEGSGSETIRRKLSIDEVKELSTALGDMNTKINSASFRLKGLTGGGFDDPKPTKFDKPTGGPSAGEMEAAAKKAQTERDSTVKGLEALAKEYEQFEAARLLDTKAQNDKEVLALEQKFDKEIEKQKEGLSKKRITEAESDAIKDRMGKLSEGKTTAIAALRVKQEKDTTDAILKFNEGLTNKLKVELDKEIENINVFYNGLVKNAGTNEAQIALIEQWRATALTDAKLREHERFQEEKKKIEAESLVSSADVDETQIAKINKKYDAEIEALRAKFTTELQATQEFKDAIDTINGNRAKDITKSKAKDEEKDAKDKKEAALQIAQETANAYFTISQRNRQAQTDADIKRLEDRKEIELSNANLTEAQKKTINDKYAKQEAEIKRKAFEADKAAAIEQAIINGALAVVKALPNPFLAVAAGAAAAAQIVIIAAQPTPVFADGGIPDGPSHAQGGMKLVGPYGQVFGEIEGGEPVLSKQTYANNRGVVDALLNSGGAQLNYDRVVEATGNREQRRSFTTSTQAPSTGASNSTAPAGSTRLDKIEELLHGFISKQAQINSIPVINSNRVKEQEDARLVAIRNDANA